MTAVDTPLETEPSTGHVDKPAAGRFSMTRSYRSWVPEPDKRRTMLVDAGASGALGLLVVNAFDPAFGAGLWLSVGAVGIFAGILVAYLTVQLRPLRSNPIFAVVVTVAGLFLLGARAVPDTAIIGFLPGVGTPSALFDGMTHGWARLLTTIPPVGTIDNLAAIVYLGGFVAAGGAMQLARRTRSSWLPVVPALVVAVAAILVGTATPASLWAQGVGVALVVLLWGSTRGARVRPRVHVVGSSAWTRRLTAFVFVGLILVSGAGLFQVQNVAGPTERFVLRRHTEPPFDPNNYPSPLSSYRDWRTRAKGDDTKDQVVLSVSGLPEGVPVRIATMDTYDGIVWRVGGGSNQDDDDAGSVNDSSRFVRVGSDLNAGSTPGAVRSNGPSTSVGVTITVENYNSVWVPTLSNVSSVEFSGERANELARALRYNRIADTAAVVSTVGGGDVVNQSASVPRVSYVGGSPETADERDGMVGDAHADQNVVSMMVPVTPDQGGKLSALSSNLIGSAGSDYEKAKNLEQGLRKVDQAWFSDGIAEEANGNPNAVFPAGHGMDQLVRFSESVNTETGAPLLVGNAERYAAAMAAMARLNGLPARVVLGFRENIEGQDSPAKRSDNTVDFAADSLDVWVEIAFAGVGWVGFYPTPPRDQSNVPPPPPKVTSERTADVQARPPVPPPQNMTELQDLSKKDDLEDKKKSDPFRLPAWLVLLLKIIFYPLIVIALIVGTIMGLKRWRRTRRRTRGSPVDRISGAWAEMLDQLRDLGERVPKKGTRLEVAAGVPGASWDQVNQFAAGINAAMFGPDDPSDESVKSIWDWVDLEQAKLLEALNSKRRWMVKLNLASLKPWR